LVRNLKISFYTHGNAKYLQQAHQSLQMLHVKSSQMYKMTILFIDRDCQAMSSANKKRGRPEASGTQEKLKKIKPYMLSSWETIAWLMVFWETR